MALPSGCRHSPVDATPALQIPRHSRLALPEVRVKHIEIGQRPLASASPRRSRGLVVHSAPIEAGAVEEGE